MSDGAPTTPLWDAVGRLGDLADRDRPAGELEVTTTHDPEVFRFRVGRTRPVEGVARVVALDRGQQRSTVELTYGTEVSSGAASLELVRNEVDLVPEAGSATPGSPDRDVAAAWVAALRAPEAAATAGQVPPSDGAGTRRWVRLASVVGVGAIVLAAAWWWSGGSVRRGGR